MELPHPEQPRRSYWHNPVLRTTQWREPDAPERVSLDGGGTQLFLEDERSTVMPSRSAVQRAGRWDLHHAIMRHGGYRRVGGRRHACASSQTLCTLLQLHCPVLHA